MSRPPRAGRSVSATTLPSAAVLLAALLTAACASGGSLPLASPDAVASAPGASGTPAASPTPSPSPTLAPPPPISWSSCGKGFQCGIVDVPRDYDDPTGPKVRLSLVRLPASDPDNRIGSLVVNPGGPGESGVEFVREGAETIFRSEVLDRFDIVGFDPRGVGSSTPVRCFDNLSHVTPIDATATTDEGLEDLLETSELLAKKCGLRNADLLPYLSTIDVARDLDVIRAALGDEQLTYLGFSYGTLIGEEYASLFPTRIRALALDGVIDPSLSQASFRRGQAIAFEKALDRFLDDCADDPDCAFHSNGQPGRAFDTLVAEFTEEPIPTEALGSREPVGPTQAWSAILGSLYTPEASPVLAAALAQAQLGDASLLLLLGDPFRGRNSDGTYSNRIDAYASVTCLDWPASRDPATYDALAAKFVEVAPRVGRLLAYNDVVCAYWTTPPRRDPAPVAAPDAPPIVLVGSTGDPATPYPWAKNVAKQLSSAVLITRVGEGHCGYSASECVREAIDAYLLEGTLPEDGLRCTD